MFKMTLSFFFLIFVNLQPDFIYGQTAPENNTSTPVKADELAKMTQEISAEKQIHIKIDMQPQLVDKMSPNDIRQVLMQSIRSRQSESKSKSEEVFIPIAAFLMIASCVFFLVYFPYLKQKQMQITIRELAKSDKTIPEAMFTLRQKPKLSIQQSDLRKGILLTVLGLSLVIFFKIVKMESEGTRAWGLGLIPFSIGCAYLLLWKLSSKKQESNCAN